ncbi:MAG: HAD family hydrolase [Planctomycetaceae bacterium]|nr:HAD family hydrolase [Planctomycetaceae bacterium]
MPVAVLLDLDNTLIDRQAAHRLFCSQFVEQHLATQSFGVQKSAIEEMVAYDQFGYTSRKSYFKWLVKRFELMARPEMLWADYRARLPELFIPNPMVCKFVEEFVKRYKVAIVSNGSSQTQRRKLARTGLAGLCSHIVISGEVGFEKPHPAIFRIALDLLGCPAESALFVGDDPSRDIAGAADVSMQTCWIRLGRSACEQGIAPDFQIDHILELENHLFE